jgi:drug/metabolite transporter (DMT)-like permease
VAGARYQVSEEALAAEPHPRMAWLYSLILLMVFFWSANFIVVKFVLREFPALLVASLRLALAGLLMLPVYAWEARQSPREPWTRNEILELLGLGVLGVALNQLFFIFGMTRTSVGHAALVISLTPMLVLIIATAVGQEHLRPRKIAGMLVAAFGISMMNFLPGRITGPNGPTFLGDLCVFLAGLTFAIFTVAGKHVSERHSSITVNTFGYVCGGLALAPLGIWQGLHFGFGQVSARGWVAVFYMALFPSVISYLIYYYALKHMPASRVSAITYLQPLIATALAVLLLGEHVTPPLLAGGAVIFSGVWLAERG